MDEMTSGMAPVAPPTGQAQAPVSPTPQPQEPTTQTQSVTPPANLQESKDFRNYQALMTRKLQEAERIAREAQQKYQEAAMSGMDDVEKTVFERDMLKSEIERLRQEQELMQMQQVRDIRLREISDQFDVPLDVIEGAETPEDAYRLTAAFLKTGRRQVANKPDLGGGGAIVGQTRIDFQMAEAVRAKNPGDVFRAVMEQQE